MDDTFGMVRDMVARLLADRATASGTMAAETRGIDSALWSAFDELGLRGDTAEIGLEGQMAVLQELGSAAALVPYAAPSIATSSAMDTAQTSADISARYDWIT